MECNKDEAARAKERAEEKFIAMDVVGAKKFALKAQSLYPGLEGISQLLATLDVYISAENKVDGIVDWYAMLGVDPRADEDIVKKHYKKLALILHPDKNKSVGAEGAFKFISQAWGVLSDKAKRVVFDQKRNRRVNRTVPTSRARSSSQSKKKSATTSNIRVEKSTSRPDHSSASIQEPRPTFWTMCHPCKMQYEYLRMYLNQNLLCPNCHEAIFATETPAPPSTGEKSNVWHFTQPNYQTGSKTEYSGGRSNVASSSNVGGSSSATRTATVVRQAYKKVKRQRKEAQAAEKEKRRRMAPGSAEREERRKRHTSKKAPASAKKEERRKHHTSKKAPGASSTPGVRVL